MGNDIIELSTDDESLRIKIGSYDGKWLEESKTKLLDSLMSRKEQT